MRLTNIHMVGIGGILIVLFALRSCRPGFVLTTAHLSAPSSRDNTLLSIAYGFEAPQFCEKISSRAYYHNWMLPRGVNSYYTRSDCYQALALKTKNESLCSKVKPLSTFLLNGSSFTPGVCRQNIRKGLQVGRLPSDGAAITAAMVQMGYTPQDALDAYIGTDPQIVASWRAGNPQAYEAFQKVSWDTYMYLYFSLSRGGPAKDDFLQRAERWAGN